MKKVKLFKPNIATRGFTLVESLIAITILTTSVMAIIGLLSQGVSSSNYAKKQMVATYLAEEGIEFVRNLRDTTVLYHASGSTAGWAAFVAKLNNCTSSNGCYFDDTKSPNSSTFSSCGTNCQELYFYPASGSYSIISNGIGGTRSGFIRKIRAQTDLANPDKIKILSTVFWSQGSGTYSMTFSIDLHNWVE